jgi:hypothetical protein
VLLYRLARQATSSKSAPSSRRLAVDIQSGLDVDPVSKEAYYRILVFDDVSAEGAVGDLF